MEKDANESGPSQPNKKQKMTIGRSFKPTDEATVPVQPSMSDSWAAQTPSASTAKSHHGKLLPLLTLKAQDVHQLELELATAQKRVKALQQVNEELEKEAADARRSELGTRSLMTRLMSTARKFQGTLAKLVSAIADYHLTMDEKKYLHSLAKDNNDMIEELKDELLNFFSRIFVDSDQEFNIWAQSITESAAARPQEPASIPAEPPVPVTQPLSARRRPQPAYALPTIAATKTPTPTLEAPTTTPSSRPPKVAKPWLPPVSGLFAEPPITPSMRLAPYGTPAPAPAAPAQTPIVSSFGFLILIMIILITVAI